MLRDIKRKVDEGLDYIPEVIQKVEGLIDSEAVILEGFKRSIQKDDYSCGAQCAFMILRYYGKARSKKNVIHELKTSEDDGTSEQSLRNLFKKRGLVSRRINRPSIKKIKEMINAGFPVLVHMDGDHWAVVYGYSKGNIYVADPSMIRSFLCKHTTEEFKSRWCKWAMVIEG